MGTSRRRWFAWAGVFALVAAPLAVVSSTASAGSRFGVLQQAFTADAGEFHTVMIAGDGTPWAVGRNQSGQLCNGSSSPSSTYVAMTGLPAGRKAVQVRAGSLMSVVLDDAGTVHGCGAAGSVSLGNTLAVLPGIPSGHRVSDIAVGFAHVVALLDDGRVFGLGRGSEGQLSGNQDRASFAPVAGLYVQDEVVDVAAGGLFTLVLDSLGTIYGTGSNATGQLGGLSSPVTALAKIGDQPAGVEPVQVGAGIGHSLMVGSNGYAYAMGANSEGQLANGTSGNTVPRWSRMRGAADVVAIDGGAAQTVVLTRSGTPMTAGANTDGQQGRAGALLPRNTELTEFGSDYLDFPAARFVEVAAGGASVIGRDADGFLFGAGNNAYSQIRSYDADDVESLRRMPQPVVRGSGGSRIIGTVQVGQTLVADPGRWVPSANVSFQYHWKRDGVAVQQSSSTRYLISPQDAGRTLAVQIFSNVQGGNNSSSAPVGVRVPGTNLARPTISGQLRVGAVVRGSVGTWNAPGYTFKYQWLRNGKAVARAVRPAYRIVKADRGKWIGLRISAVKPAFPSVIATSTAKRALRSR